jgi:hypothetical protein
LSRYSPYNTLSPRFLATVKDEPVEAAPSGSHCDGSRGGSLVICEASPPCQCEWTPPPEYKVVASIVKAEDDPEEFPRMRQAQ